MTTVQEKFTTSVSFSDNKLLPILLGEYDKHLNHIEQEMKVSTSSRGNTVSISGHKDAVENTAAILNALYKRVERGLPLDNADVDAAIRMSRDNEIRQDELPLTNTDGSDVFIKTPKKAIYPHSKNQAYYIKQLQQNEVVFALGPAGTGKTYIAVAMAVSMFNAKKVDRIILSRPAVEAGEKLGFLPGDIKDKIDPYLRPLYDALHDMMPSEKVMRYMETGEIELAPLAFMRGRTLSNAFIILDEAQNTTPMQMKMFLTRLGENSRMIVTGDLTQIDLPSHSRSGLKDAVDKLGNIAGIEFANFKEKDIMRHPLAAKIVHAYDEWDKQHPPATD